MTSREILDRLSDTLMCDEHILSVRERELIVSLLQRARTQAGGNGVVTEMIAQAVGEIVAQRAYGVLGDSITRRLSGHLSHAVPAIPDKEDQEWRGQDQPIPDSRPRTAFQSGPNPVGPIPPSPGPHPPGPKGKTGDWQAQFLSGPNPVGPIPPSPGPHPPGPKGKTGDWQAQFLSGPNPVGPIPPSPGPHPPGPEGKTGDWQAQAESIAVLDMPAILPAECAVLEEFLAPSELDDLLQYTLRQESSFSLSEVISPGCNGGMVDHEHRRSRVLMDLGKHNGVLLDRIQSSWPRILSRLGHDPFVASRVEAQITASSDGDFFRRHTDNGAGEIALREITFVYFFHREPKTFQGGELRIYDSRFENGAYIPSEDYRTIVPQQNQMVLFASSLSHEITPVECASKAFADSRFTVNGWFHR